MKKLEFGKNFYEEYVAENRIKEGKATRYYSREILKSVTYEMEDDYDKLREEFSYEKKGKIAGKAIQYFLNNKIQENYAGLGIGNDVKSAFRSFKDILGIYDDEETIKVIENKGIAEDRKEDYV